ncbi:hypothetical protein KsCSTR_24410 [Candidatus Kuenenia stuttgartiensis]|uniref:Uncharacterized protein n=1 Tax=Kuenenia stuttgartiensis TaxID=174633 RepID=Q1Q3Y2_KUEST|nr:hypothetical protein KsCSTR_24410 [Candidatus Kuenenia stuttgartiensis]CAJ74713.1 unknown protein [Candidatus Kuenenia stuttgartiensis]
MLIKISCIRLKTYSYKLSPRSGFLYPLFFFNKLNSIHHIFRYPYGFCFHHFLQFFNIAFMALYSSLLTNDDKQSNLFCASFIVNVSFFNNKAIKTAGVMYGISRNVIS